MSRDGILVWDFWPEIQRDRVTEVQVVFFNRYLPKLKVTSGSVHCTVPEVYFDLGHDTLKKLSSQFFSFYYFSTG